MWALKAKQGLVAKSVLVIVVVVLAAGGLYIGFIKKDTNSINNKLKSTSSTSKPSQPSVVEKVNATPTKTALANVDYVNYQNLQQGQATLYLYNSNISDAERIMDDVIKNVPASDINSSSYLTMVAIQQSKKDTTQEKKYLQLAIDKLNAEGNTRQAASEQTVLDGLK